MARKNSKQDAKARAKLLRAWAKLDEADPGTKALKTHCGGRGLAIGCPVCDKREPK